MMAKHTPHGKGIVKWVSPQWLMDHLSDESLTILDAQPNVHDYIIRHIPTAVYFNELMIHAPVNGRPAQYVPPAAFESIARRTGIRSDRPVVVYTGKGAFKGWGDGLEQSAVAYALARFGHPDVYILDGGLEQWLVEGHPVSKAYPDVAESDFTVALQRDLFLTYEDFKAIRDQEDVILLDVRPPKPYLTQSMWPLPGHIPGAINVPWDSFYHPENPRSLKSDDEIQAIVAQKGLVPDKTIVCSCGTGRKATLVFLLLRWYLGFPKVLLYEGSFTEWSSYPDNPTVTGPNPR